MITYIVIKVSDPIQQHLDPKTSHGEKWLGPEAKIIYMYIYTYKVAKFPFCMSSTLQLQPDLMMMMMLLMWLPAKPRQKRRKIPLKNLRRKTTVKIVNKCVKTIIFFECYWFWAVVKKKRSRKKKNNIKYIRKKIYFSLPVLFLYDHVNLPTLDAGLLHCCSTTHSTFYIC